MKTGNGWMKHLYFQNKSNAKLETGMFRWLKIEVSEGQIKIYNLESQRNDTSNENVSHLKHVQLFIHCNFRVFLTSLAFFL